MIFIKYILILCSLLNWTEIHDLHLSNSLVQYKSDENALQITIKIFADDLELAILNNYGEDLKLFSDNESPISDELIRKYLEQNLIFTVDDELLAYDYIGKEMSEDLSSVWCYLEYENLALPGTIQLENRILIDQYDDQRNMVMFKVDNERKAHHTFDNKDIITQIVF